MRIDAHTHFYGEDTLAKLKPVVKEHGVSHLTKTVRSAPCTHEDQMVEDFLRLPPDLNNFAYGFGDERDEVQTA